MSDIAQKECTQLTNLAIDFLQIVFNNNETISREAYIRRLITFNVMAITVLEVSITDKEKPRDELIKRVNKNMKALNKSTFDLELMDRCISDLIKHYTECMQVPEK